MREVKVIRGVKEVALHIYHCGVGSVENEYVDAILEELNERIGGNWEAGVSNDKITWIEQIL